MIIYCQKPSESARLLARHLGAVVTPHPEGDDWTICWGFPLRGERVLNGRAGVNKLRELQAFHEAGVPHVPFSLTERRGWWLPRRAHHTQGIDFIRPPRVPAFWVQRLQIEDEWRFHMFRRRGGAVISLRAGHRLPGEGRHHPWVRSVARGWRIAYEGGAPNDLRLAARAALDALHLDFAAIDTGRLADGTPLVIEANTRPGIDEGGQTILHYAAEIRRRCV